MICNYHLCNTQLVGRQTRFCSKVCSVKFHVKNNRIKKKRALVIAAGGRCVRCGYSKCLNALHFHHVGEKEFGVGSGNTYSWARTIAEAAKCELICANCHAEEHSGGSL